ITNTTASSKRMRPSHDMPEPYRMAEGAGSPRHWSVGTPERQSASTCRVMLSHCESCTVPAPYPTRPPDPARGRDRRLARHASLLLDLIPYCRSGIGVVHVPKGLLGDALRSTDHFEVEGELGESTPSLSSDLLLELAAVMVFVQLAQGIGVKLVEHVA